MRTTSWMALGVLVAMTSASTAGAQSAAVPSDVLQALGGATTCRPASFARALAFAPPPRVLGYNSRMDNASQVEGAQALDEFRQALSQSAGYALASGDAGVRAQMMDALAYWAGSGALLGTATCTRGGRLDQGSCPEWQDPEGRDLSPMKDFTDVQMSVATFRRAYFLTLSGFETEARAGQHAAIRAWFDAFDARMKTPSDVYFGLQVGWYWPAIDEAVASGEVGRAQRLAQSLLRGLNGLLNADGSLEDRTTRGDHALWYHNEALNETIHSMEMARALGVAIPPGMEDRLHAAVNLFIRAVVDHSAIDPWAQEAHNGRYAPGYQEWRTDWPNGNWGGTWWHVYAYRYPGRAEAAWLAQAVSPGARSAIVDGELGIGLGCVYATARQAR